MARMLRLLTTVLISVFLPIISVSAPPDSLPPPAQVQLVPAGEGLTDVTGISHADDDRLFVTEQAGTIRIVRDGSVIGPPFLDISSG